VGQQRILFVSDLHIRPGCPEPFQRLCRLFETLRDQDTLFFLGDLFDYWVGPKHLGHPDYQPLLARLRRLAGSGVHVYFIHGNRDYLIDERFQEATGVQVLGREHVLTLNDLRLLLTHGDFVYTRDRLYRFYRGIMEVKAVRRAFLWAPLSLEIGIALALRSNPIRSKGQVMDILDPARRVFERGYDVLICGHVHIPCAMEVPVPGSMARLFILGDWGGSGEYLEYCGTEFRMKRIGP
jgi:UDP-2,3-diacylglucosamine hydrolase